MEEEYPEELPEPTPRIPHTNPEPTVKSPRHQSHTSAPASRTRAPSGEFFRIIFFSDLPTDIFLTLMSIGFIYRGGTCALTPSLTLVTASSLVTLLILASKHHES